MRKKTDNIIMAVQGLVILYCSLTCIYTIVMGKETGGQQLPAAMCLAALIVAARYVLKGYVKEEAKVYKLMLLLSAATALLCLVPHVKDPDISQPIGSILCTIGYILCCGLYLVLALVQDLGKTKSNIIVLVIFLFYLAVLISCLIYRPGMMMGEGTRADSMRIFRHICMIELAVNAGLSVYFKYRDKEARGSK